MFLCPALSKPKRLGQRVAALAANSLPCWITGRRAVMEDDLVCEYDSTWDTESDGDELADSVSRRPCQDKAQKTWGFMSVFNASPMHFKVHQLKQISTQWSNQSSRNLRAAKDMQNYRRGYPNINEEECPEEKMNNLKFYLNEITSSPDEISIEVFHKDWKTDYKRLERVHSYIQWLFPLREPGVNYMASELTKKEIQEFRKNEEAKRRLVESYELMLGFYGIQLVNKETGEVKRADNWRERFANLERNMHNNLRITRILKCLGELGFEHYQAPLVRFFLEETLVRKNLNTVKRSVLDYFVFAVRDKKDRRNLIKFAYQHYEPKDKFVWCPRRIQKRLKKKSEKKQEMMGSRENSGTDEGRSKINIKEGDGGTVVKEAKTARNIPESQKPAEERDSHSQFEVSLVDPEQSTIDSSDDPQLLSNGEIDNLSSSQSNSPKAGAENASSKTMETETNGAESVTHEPTVPECAPKKQTKKKREGALAKDSNGSEESSHDGETLGRVSSDNSPDLGRLEHAGSTSSPAKEGRAQKQPRTDFSDESDGASNGDIMDTTEMSCKSVAGSSESGKPLSDSVSMLYENGKVPEEEWTKGSAMQSVSEPMEMDTTSVTQMEVDKP